MAARLPPASAARLRTVLGPDEELIEVESLSDLSHVLHTRPIDLLVLDPGAFADDEIAQDESEPSELLTLLSEFRSVPAILYAAHTRQGLRGVLPLARSGAHQVIFRGFDDSYERLRALLDQVAASALGERLLAIVLPKLTNARVPVEVTEAIARLFRAPQAFRTVQQLAGAAGRQRGPLDRWMQRAGLAPAKTLMLAARVAWAHHYVRAPGSSYKTLALRLGYRDTVPLGRHVKWITGLTPSQLRRDVSPDELLEILRGRIVR